MYYGVPTVLKFLNPAKFLLKSLCESLLNVCVREIGALLSSTTGVVYRCNVHLQIELITNNWRKEIYDLECKMEFMDWLSDKRIDSIR